MRGVLGAEVNLCGSMSIGPLDNDPLWLDVELCEFLFLRGIVAVVVAGVDAHFDLRVEPRVDFRGGVETVVRE